MDNSIQILHSSKIDHYKWNNCIESSINSLIYADYLFLTTQCDNWSGLIIGDYKTVMPLPWRKKWGIRYLYAPAFIQQLGFFGELSSLPLLQIFNYIKDFAKFGDIFFNYQNIDLIKDLKCFSKTNFLINLDSSYPKIFGNYSHDLIKNLQKSEKQNLTYSSDIIIEDAINQFQLQYQDRFPHFHLKEYTNLLKACNNLAKRDQCIVRCVFAETTNKPLSIALLLKDKQRIYLLLNSTTTAGRSLAANHYLIDRIIQEFCEEDLLFDFEGSERKGIKEFYESFHPENQPYFHYRFNDLPYIFNLARKILNKS